MDVELVQQLANDEMVCMAARVSTIGNKAQSYTREKNRGLINFLVRDRHGSPFEHGSFTFRICAPIFVVREFMRHRAGMSYNEESGRYKELEPVFYIPAGDRPLVQFGKAGAYDFKPGTFRQALVASEAMRMAYTEAWTQYQAMLDQGIAREVARSVLPVGTFSTFYVTCNPRSLMHFLSLRTKSDHARYKSFPQVEIQMVADQMEEHFKTYMPITHETFVQHGRVAP
ncbi:FAD-dependent thymidylate synthase [Streptomyces sp. NBC_01216]|uniref:FAD-dependent thymidylate synthase n=1 Tax=Streptomyces sp. NBC_01216 TaxID=2903778 RepID=UPI002E12E879|nr:FAD-dependent thymidylate synthase [Streptomyces sp. NBC_01216]